MASNPTIVIDNGSGHIKAGFAGADQPQFVSRSIVGESKFGMSYMSGKHQYVGEEAIKRRGLLNIKRPIEYGIITDWDLMETLWSDIFDNGLKVNPAGHNVLLTEASNTPKENREKKVQVMFEKFNVSGVCVVPNALLSLYATGRSTGLVVDSGYEATTVVPVVNNTLQRQCFQRLPLAGAEVTAHLSKLMTDGYEIGSQFSAEIEVLDEAKISKCLVSLDYEADMAKSPQETVSYELPDGSTINFTTQRFEAPEVLFQPRIRASELPGLHVLASNAIKRCEESVRKDLYANVILSGRSCLFPGFKERMEKELTALDPGAQVNVFAPSNAFSTWQGGSMMASSEDFHNRCISRAEYDEAGPSIVHERCG